MPRNFYNHECDNPGKALPHGFQEKKGRREILSRLRNKLSSEELALIRCLVITDPLGKRSIRYAMLYTAVLVVLLLFPFDFKLIALNHTQWNNENDGISFQQAGMVISDRAAAPLIEKLQNGSGLSIEVWIETQDVAQSGPARILSCSRNTALRNFTLGQSFDQLVFRLRTTHTDLNGTHPHLVLEKAFLPGKKLQVVVTYDFSEQQVFVDGELRKKSRLLKGDFSNWDGDYRIVLGNEATGDRPWLGHIYSAAIYNKALTTAEVLNRYEAGFTEPKTSYSSDDSSLKLIAAYWFDEKSGSVITDRSSGPDPVNLLIPTYIQKESKPYLSLPRDYTNVSRLIDHFIMNAMILFPFGFLVRLSFRRHTSIRPLIFSMAIGAVFIFTMESLQYFSLTRDSSLLDACANLLGVALGSIAGTIYQGHLKREADRIREML